MAVKVTGAVLKQLGAIYRGGTVAGLSDAELLERFACRADEAVAEAAFSAIVTRHGPMVLGVCRDLVPDPGDAEDAFQATFLVLARKAGSVRVDDSAGRWLYGVARKVATRARKRSAGRRDVTVGTLPEVVSTAPGPIDVALSRERAELLRAEVARLPSRYREAVVLCHLEGRSLDEAAARLGRPVGTIKARLSRARSMLRARLSRIGLDAGMLPVVPGPLLHRTVRLVVQDAFRSTSLGTIAGASAVSGTIINLAEGVLAMTGWAKVQAAGIAALSVGVTAVAVGGLATREGSGPEGRNAPGFVAGQDDGGDRAERIEVDEPAPNAARGVGGDEGGLQREIELIRRSIQNQQGWVAELAEQAARAEGDYAELMGLIVEAFEEIEQDAEVLERKLTQHHAESGRPMPPDEPGPPGDEAVRIAVVARSIQTQIMVQAVNLRRLHKQLQKAVALYEPSSGEEREPRSQLDVLSEKLIDLAPRPDAPIREADRPVVEEAPAVDMPPDDALAVLKAEKQRLQEQYTRLWADLEPRLRAGVAADEDNPTQVIRQAEARLTEVDQKRDVLRQKLARVDRIRQEAEAEDPDVDPSVYQDELRKLKQEMLELEYEEIEARAGLEAARRKSAASDPRNWIERRVEQAFLADERARDLRKALGDVQGRINEVERRLRSGAGRDVVRPVRPPSGAPEPLVLRDEPVTPGEPVPGLDKEPEWDPEGVESPEVDPSLPPEYIVEPPDLIRIEVLEALPGRPITGERLVRPDGRISLDFYGEIYVSGLTLSEVKEKVILLLRKFLTDEALGLIELDPDTLDYEMIHPIDSNRVFVDVAAYNSKVYYVQGDVVSPGRLHITGNDTVLDAINYVGGLLPTADPGDIRLIRPAESGSGGEAEVLMVDLEAIVSKGDTATNYPIKAGDRLVVSREPERIVEQEFLNHEEVQQLRDERARLEEKIDEIQRVVRNADDPALRQLQADRERVIERYKALWDEQAPKLRERLGVDPSGSAEDAGPPPIDGHEVDLYRFTGPRYAGGTGGSAINPELVEQLRALLERLEATQERGNPAPVDVPSPSVREVEPPAAEREVDPPSGFVPRSEEQAAEQKPALRIDLVGPSGGDVLLGREFDFQMTVRNEGEGEARDVDLIATISGGLQGFDRDGSHDDARRFELAIGDLGPGEVRGPFPLSVRATGLGVQSCSMKAESPDLAPEAPEETKEVTVVAPKLSLDVQGPDRRPVGSVAEYVVTVKNEGTAAATEVAVALFAPESGSPDVPKDAQYRQDPEKRIHNIYWRLPRLDKGESRQFRVPIRLDRIATYTVEVAAHSEGFRGPKETLREQYLTDVVGIADVKIVEVGRKDAVIGEGDTTEFEIRIRNDGSKEATNVRVDFNTNEWITVEKTDPPDAAYNPANPVQHGFAPIDRLPPGAERTYLVTVKAAKAPPSGQIAANFDVKVFWDGIPESAAVSASSNLRIGEVEGR